MHGAPAEQRNDARSQLSLAEARAGKAAQAIRAESYGAALETLEHLLAQGHLTPEQKELVSDFVSQLQKSKQDKR